MDPRLIVALDTSDRAQALGWVTALRPVVGTFKIGLELFAAHGPQVVGEVAAAGARVFLDLKFHDIPNTVAGAVHSACRLPGVSLMTVHAGGGRRMLQAAVQAARECRREDFASDIPGARRPGLLGVTVLTSLEAGDLREVGVEAAPPAQVARLAALARESGLDGLVCSPLEVAALRRELGNDVLLVTPGVRPRGAAAGEPRRVSTPAEAIAAGASRLVVGRPITAATSPLDAARAILDELP